MSIAPLFWSKTGENGHCTKDLLIALCLVIISPLTFGVGRVKLEDEKARNPAPGQTEKETGLIPEGALPDIYYIILDGYGGGIF